VEAAEVEVVQAAVGVEEAEVAVGVALGAEAELESSEQSAIP
jgi:hypothetical protein